MGLISRVSVVGPPVSVFRIEFAATSEYKKRPVTDQSVGEVAATFVLHDSDREPPKCLDDLGLGFPRLDPQIPALRRANHLTRHIVLVNEY